MPTNPNRIQVHIDRALTNISVAYIQSASAFISARVFPVVPVQKQSDRYFVYKREDWYRDEAKERAPMTESAGGGYDIDNTPTYFCKKYAYHKDVGEEDRTNADAPLNPDQDAVDFVTTKLLLKREVLWAEKFFTSGVWSTEYTGVAATPGAGQFLQWNDATSNPIEDIDKAQTMLLELTGYKPNKLVLGAWTYKALKNHPNILDRIKYTQRGIVTTDILAMLFDVDEVLVAEAVQNLSPKGVAENNKFILGKHALLVYAAPRPALKTPSAGYTFAWTGLMGAGAYGNRILRFPMDHLGVGTERIEGEMAFDQKVVAADMGAFFKDAVA
ncbi:MAG TPA: major capsid protein [Bacillota bacterium]|nr:major capsid protein [Bacillota bacterium]